MQRIYCLDCATGGRPESVTRSPACWPVSRARIGETPCVSGKGKTDLSVNPDTCRPSLLIVGASARAAAQSALRAGFAPICADSFADSDLRACARVLPVEDYPAGLCEALRGTKQTPWLYTGSLENRPDVLATLARELPLLGNAASVVGAVRDPNRLYEVLVTRGLPALPVLNARDAPPPPDGTWMLKPRRGAAGRGVIVWDAAALASGGLNEPGYFQQRVDGVEHSALFLAAKGSAELVGTSRQLVGLEWAGAARHAWCGNLVPAGLPRDVEDTMEAIGQALVEHSGLRGLFGCDFLVSRGIPWLTEVNPRYTGSTELFEYQQRRPLLAAHARACGFVAPVQGWDIPQLDALPRRAATGPEEALGKLIIYAVRDGKFPGIDVLGPELFRDDRQSWQPTSGGDPFAMPLIADIPAAGQPLRAGDPVCTLFARGSSAEGCLALLRQRADALDHWL